MKNSGATLLELALTLAISISLLLISASTVSDIVKKIDRTIQVETFVREVFIGLRMHYFNELVSSGCYTVAPEPITAYGLSTRGLLDSSLLQPKFFDAQNVVLAFESNSSRNKVDTMVVIISFPQGTRDLDNMPEQFSKTETSLTFKRKIEFSQELLVINNISTSFCKGS